MATHLSKRIDRLRRRIRALYLQSGLGRVLAVVASLLLLSFVLDSRLIDNSLVLPIGVRYASFAITLIAVGVLVARLVVRPLRRRIPDEDLVLAAESRIPELEDRLISAHQFREQLGDPENAESPAMMRAVIEEADRLDSALEARRILDAGRVRRHVLQAGVAIAVLAGVLLATNPAVARMWFERNLLLRDVEWPKTTRNLLVVNFPEDRERVVTRGESVVVNVWADGEIPDEAVIRWRQYEEDDPEVQRTPLPLARVRGEEFHFTAEFSQIPQSLEFWVVGGDDLDEEPLYRVRALAPPTIEALTAECRFPIYAGGEKKEFSGGDLEIPLGTEVRLRVAVDMELKSARLLPDGARDPVIAEIDGRTATLDLGAVNRSLSYSIHLVGEEGQSNTPESTRYRIRAVPDKKPHVRVANPVSRPWWTLSAIVPMKLLATDNYGVSRVILRYRMGSQKVPHPREFLASELSAPAGSRRVVAYAALPIAELTADETEPVKVGRIITFHAEALDNNGNLHASDPFSLEVVTAEELERRLAQRQAALRRDLLGIRKYRQEPAFQKTVETLDFLQLGGSPEEVDRETLRAILVPQGAVTREIDRFSSAVAAVFNTYVYNRLTNPPVTERILVRMDDYLKSDHEDLAIVFKRDLYRELIRDYREGTLRDHQTLAVLLEILELTIKIGERTSPAAHEILTRLSQGESEAGLKADIERLREIQTDILHDLSLLEVKMRQWETYAQIIDIVRKILSTQEGVRGSAERIRKDR